MGSTQSLTAEQIQEKNTEFFSAHPGLEGQAATTFVHLDERKEDAVEYNALLPHLQNLVIAVFGQERFAKVADDKGVLDSKKVESQTKLAGIQTSGKLTLVQWLSLVNIWFSLLETNLAEEIKLQEKVQEELERQMVAYREAALKEQQRQYDEYLKAHARAVEQLEQQRKKALEEQEKLYELHAAAQEAAAKEAEEYREKALAAQQKQYDDYMKSITEYQQAVLQEAEERDLSIPHVSSATNSLRVKRRANACC